MLVSQAITSDIPAQGQQTNDSLQVNRELVSTLLDDVDKKVAEKSEEMWHNGKLMMSQLQAKHREETDALQAQLRQCLDNQRALEADNAQLKLILAQLASQLTMTGGFPSDNTSGMPDFGIASAGLCMTSPSCQSGVATTRPGSVASASPLAASHGSSADHIFSSPANGLSTMSIASFLPVPEVPAFPFPAEPAPSLAEMVGTPCAPGLAPSEAVLGAMSGDSAAAEGATRLSLAEALGAQSPERRPLQPPSLPTPVSLADSLPSAALDGNNMMLACDSGAAFSFTLHKWDGMSLGLNISHHVDDMCLCVEDVRPEGAVDAWNQQCAAGAFPEQVVRAGDKIVSVNNITCNPELMLEECKLKPLLHLTVVKGERSLAESAGAKTDGCNMWPNGSPGGLRADASEFVPMGVAGFGMGGSS